jgi:septum formation protein
VSVKGAKPRLILASASPRRLALLQQIGIEPHDVVAAEIDETPQKTELPRSLALRLAREKAEAVASDHSDAFVLGADTVVACGRRILPKAETESEARACLDLLSGRAHRVWTAVHLAAPGRASERVCETRVTFKRLSEDEISFYLASGEWRGKAGGYAIQGRAALFVRALTGSYSAVVGLPLHETGALLAGAGYPVISMG